MTQRKPEFWSPQARKVAFWSRVDRRGPNECWPWKGKHTRKGYGQFEIARGRMIHANRQALIFTEGPLDEKILACHTCDNPPCCNPRHLFQGSPMVNARDSILKGRFLRSHGATHPQAKLFTFIDRIKTRYVEGESVRSLARDFAVAPNAIKQLLIGKSYRQEQLNNIVPLRAPKPAQHGSRSKYVKGCRCQECRAMNATYHRELRSRHHQSA